tara:strand:+ start:60 stop:545 length:486 start_codon:yes stop_codon:yes gene_type:complete
MGSNFIQPQPLNPTKVGMVGTSPANSAMVTVQQNNASQANANKLMAGGKFRKSRRNSKRRRNRKSSKQRYVKRGGATTVPQFQKPAGPQVQATGGDTNSQITAGSATYMQQGANSRWDSQASIKGGTKRKRGGTRIGGWTCMSGGKRSRGKRSRRRTSRNA